MAWYLYIVRTSTIAKNRHVATLPWHTLDRRGSLAWYLYIVRTSTIAKNRHLATLPWHGQFAEQFYLFIQTPLDRRGMASLQSNSTFSFKHHLSGEAFLAWYLYIVRTSEAGLFFLVPAE